MSVRFDASNYERTFGRVRKYNNSVRVSCRRCDHARILDSKALRFLKHRLPDDLELSAAVFLFRCTACNYNLVRVEMVRGRFHPLSSGGNEMPA